MKARRARKVPTRAIRVDYALDHDRYTAWLGLLGFSTRFISSKTELTHCQVTYRLRQLGIRRMDYRNGDSPIAIAVVRRSIGSSGDKAIVTEVDSDFKARVERYLKEND